MDKPVIININIKYLIKEVKIDEIQNKDEATETIFKIINSVLENLKSNLSKSVDNEKV